MGWIALIQAAVESTASVWDSIAVGAGCGAVNPWTVTSGGRLGAIVFKQSSVMYSVEFGLINRMLILRSLGGPDTLGSSVMASMA